MSTCSALQVGSSVEEGYEALTVRGLAAEAGVTHSCDLQSVQRTAGAHCCPLRAAAQRRWSVTTRQLAVTDDPISELLPLRCRIEPPHRSRPTYTRCSTHRPLLMAGRWRSIRSKSNARSVIVQDTIRRAILAGQLRPVDDHDLFQGLWGIVHGPHVTGAAWGARNT